MRANANSDAQWQELLEEQVRLNAPLFFRIAWRMLRDSSAAEDICQQALLKAWTERHSIGQPDRLRAWLTRTVVNGSLELLRRRRVEQKALANLPSRHDDPSPPDLIANAEALTAALTELPESLRLVVVLRISQGLSGNEVSDLLGISAAAVSRALHQGLDQLRSVLTDSFSHR